MYFRTCEIKDDLLMRIALQRAQLHAVAQATALSDPALLAITEQIDQLYVEWLRDEYQPIPARGKGRGSKAPASSPDSRLLVTEPARR